MNIIKKISSFFDLLILKPRLGRVRFMAMSFFWLCFPAIIYPSYGQLVYAIWTNNSAKEETYLMLITNMASFFDSEYVVIKLVVLALVSLLTIIQLNLLSIRRLHDMNLRGWWLLLTFVIVYFCTHVPYFSFSENNINRTLDILLYILGLIPSFILAFWPGTKSENRFGQIPNKPHFIHWILATANIVTTIICISTTFRLLLS